MSDVNSENIYFTNDLEDLDFVKICLKENSIPHEIIFNNNSHPIFGTNMALGMDSVLYKYAVRVPLEFVEKAQSLLNEVLDSEETQTEEEEIPVADAHEVLNSSAPVKEKVSKKSPAGILVILLLVLHFSRYFSQVKQRGSSKGKTVLLYLIGIFWMIFNIGGLVLVFTGSGVYDFYYLLYAFITVLVFASGYEAVINFVDFLIERKKVQKIWCILSLLICIAGFILSYNL